jgi:hypothetical protein
MVAGAPKRAVVAVWRRHPRVGLTGPTSLFGLRSVAPREGPSR